MPLLFLFCLFSTHACLYHSALSKVGTTRVTFCFFQLTGGTNAFTDQFQWFLVGIDRFKGFFTQDRFKPGPCTNPCLNRYKPVVPPCTDQFLKPYKSVLNIYNLYVCILYIIYNILNGIKSVSVHISTYQFDSELLHGYSLNYKTLYQGLKSRPEMLYWSRLRLALYRSIPDETGLNHVSSAGEIARGKGNRGGGTRRLPLPLASLVAPAMCVAPVTCCSFCCYLEVCSCHRLLLHFRRFMEAWMCSQQVGMHSLPAPLLLLQQLIMYYQLMPIEICRVDD